MITPSFSITATERVLPALSLNFTSAALDPRITFSRSGNTATRINSNGFVEKVNADVPRFDFNPLTLACRGLLIEQSSTNLSTTSDTFDAPGSTWSWARLTVENSSELSPDGVLNSKKLVENTAIDTHRLGYFLNITSGVTYTFSIFLKPNGRDKFIFRTGSTTIFGSFANASFDLTAKTASFASPWLSATIEEYKNGWFRCSASITAIASTTSQTSVVFLDMLDSSGNRTYQGDGVSGFFVWGGQTEESAFITSYIPTGASQVTRTSDVATMTGTNFSDWYSAGIGGVVARVLPSTVSGTRPALQFDDATANELITLRGDTTNPELVIVDGGAPQAQIDAGTIAANTAYNLGAAWNTDNCAAAVNGGAAVTDTSATIPTVTQTRLGSDGTNYLNGHLQTLRYWPQRIINAEVQAFSK